MVCVLGGTRLESFCWAAGPVWLFFFFFFKLVAAAVVPEVVVGGGGIQWLVGVHGGCGRSVWMFLAEGKIDGIVNGRMV